MISYHSIIRALKSIGLKRDIPVLLHLGEAVGAEINGGIDTLMGALLSIVDNIMIPAFTFSTMITPEDGPVNNNMVYGESTEKNLNANIFSPSLVSELSYHRDAIQILQKYSGVYRSSHPIFSFYGLGLDVVLLDHTPDQTYLPIKKLNGLGGWVLMIGVDSSRNFSIHYAEHLAGRKQFLRWALTEDGIAVCPHFPGCPEGFHKLDYYLQDEIREKVLDEIQFRAVSLHTLITTTTALLEEDPFALLCNDLQCTRCNLVRSDIKQQISSDWEPENTES